MIPSEFKDFGLVDVPRDRPACFRVFSSPYVFETIYTSGQPMHVYWSGNSIIVEMDNGTKRVYHGLSDSQYQIIY